MNCPLPEGGMTASTFVAGVGLPPGAGAAAPEHCVAGGGDAAGAGGGWPLVAVPSAMVHSFMFQHTHTRAVHAPAHTTLFRQDQTRSPRTLTGL